MFKIITRGIIGGFLTGVVVFTATYGTPPADRSGEETAEASMRHRPANVPTWQPGHQRRFPDCGPGQQPDTIPDTVIVVQQDGTTTRVTYDAAWSRIENRNRGDDMWVIGFCY